MKTKFLLLFGLVFFIANCQNQDEIFKETVLQNEAIIMLSKQKQQEIIGYFTEPRAAIFGNYIKLRPYYQRIKTIELASDSLLVGIDQLKKKVDQSKTFQLRNSDLKQLKKGFSDLETKILECISKRDSGFRAAISRSLSVKGWAKVPVLQGHSVSGLGFNAVISKIQADVALSAYDAINYLFNQVDIYYGYLGNHGPIIEAESQTIRKDSTFRANVYFGITEFPKEFEVQDGNRRLKSINGKVNYTEPAQNKKGVIDHTVFVAIYSPLTEDTLKIPVRVNYLVE